MCPGLDQAGAAAGSSGVSQDKFSCWLPGLGEEELLDLWEILDLWELLGLSEFLGLWVPGSAELVSFWDLLGLEELSDFFGDSGFLRAAGFIPGVSRLPQPCAGSRSWKLPLFLSNHHRPQNKDRRNPIKQPEELLLAAGAPGREGKSWVWRELSADSH